MYIINVIARKIINNIPITMRKKLKNIFIVNTPYIEPRVMLKSGFDGKWLFVLIASSLSSSLVVQFVRSYDDQLKTISSFIMKFLYCENLLNIIAILGIILFISLIIYVFDKINDIKKKATVAIIKKTVIKIIVNFFVLYISWKYSLIPIIQYLEWKDYFYMPFVTKFTVTEVLNISMFSALFSSFNKLFTLNVLSALKPSYITKAILDIYNNELKMCNTLGSNSSYLDKSSNKSVLFTNGNNNTEPIEDQSSRPLSPKYTGSSNPGPSQSILPTRSEELRSLPLSKDTGSSNPGPSRLEESTILERVRSREMSLPADVSKHFNISAYFSDPSLVKQTCDPASFNNLVVSDYDSDKIRFNVSTRDVNPQLIEAFTFYPELYRQIIYDYRSIINSTYYYRVRQRYITSLVVENFSHVDKHIHSNRDGAYVLKNLYELRDDFNFHYETSQTIKLIHMGIRDDRFKNLAAKVENLQPGWTDKRVATRTFMCNLDDKED